MDESQYIYLSAIEDELQRAINRAEVGGVEQLYEMLTYHMGWEDIDVKNSAKGKRIRPLLVLLICTAGGGNWKNALPAAIAVEMVHNFSLIHDDIQDHSPIRRGRPAVWKKWGIAQAINAGDAMFTLAHLQIIDMKEYISESATLRSIKVIQQACLALTHGQYLDLAFEIRDDVTIDDYWKMVEGKTAALLSACTELGALSAHCNEHTIAAYRNFGKYFGLAYQVQDDLLGIWGRVDKIGKSNLSDLATRKKTLPVLYGLSRNGEFSRLWYQQSNSKQEIKTLKDILEAAGARSYAQEMASKLVDKALLSLADAHPLEEAAELLKSITYELAQRDY